ncbi:MAG: DNA repair protein RecN [Erysipelothrix sp.]|nr:DNA repair protein RecN [Erysipelothrix sp.]
MLVNLYLENYILFDKQSLSFNNGFIAVTGDTGAGKSLIIDALGYLCGNRLSGSLQKDMSKPTFIEGVFQFDNANTLATLNEYGIDDDETYIVSRTIDPLGKSISRINGRSITLAQLKRLFENEVDIHTQRDNQYLLNKTYHLQLVDAFAQNDGLLNNVKETYKTYTKLLSNKEELLNTSFNEEELDFIKFQLSEIEKLKMDEKEYLNLLEMQKDFSNYELIFSSLSTSYQQLNASKGIIEGLFNVKETMKQLHDIKPFDEVNERLNSLYLELSDVKYEIGHELDGLDYDEFEVNQVEQRLFEINQCLRRYGGSFESFNLKKEEYESKIEQADNKEYLLSKLDKEIEDTLSVYMSLAQSLSDHRKQSVTKLEAEIMDHLKDLQLENTQFSVNFIQKDPSSNGIDDIEFMVAMNKGFDLAPLIKVASGGELSRLMLGLKTVFSKLFGVSTIVFDEIDTGVSGSVASNIGAKMYELSKFTQVFTITHLGQVAAYSDEHYYVEKDNTKDVGFTNIKKLDEHLNKEKIALMATGMISESSLNTADEIIHLAKKHRDSIG